MTTSAIDQAIEALAHAAFLEGQATAEHLVQAHALTLQCKEALRETLTKAQEVQATALCEAQIVLNSINQGRQHEVKVGDEICYWQRKEWITWAVKEVLPQVSAALTGLRCSCCHKQSERGGLMPVYVDDMRAG